MQLGRQRPVKVIVAADDFGCSLQVNQAIMELAALRKITSTSIIANAPEFEQAASFARAGGECSFGIHLNLTQFKPLAGPGGLEPILDSDGGMKRVPNRAFANARLLRACYRELSSQIERCLQAGIRIACLDSHHHVHTNPILLPLFKRLQCKYKIRGIRLTKNIYLGPQPGIKKKTFKDLYNLSLRLGCSSKLTQGFTEFLTFYGLARKQDLPFTSIELMTHPGADAAEEEQAVLKSSWQDDLKFPVKLINYNEL